VAGRGAKETTEFCRFWRFSGSATRDWNGSIIAGFFVAKHASLIIHPLLLHNNRTHSLPVLRSCFCFLITRLHFDSCMLWFFSFAVTLLLGS